MRSIQTRLERIISQGVHDGVALQAALAHIRLTTVQGERLAHWVLDEFELIAVPADELTTRLLATASLVYPDDDVSSWTIARARRMLDASAT